MREIKFRGKRVDNGEWVYGSLLQSEIDINKLAVQCEIHERFANDFSIRKYAVIPESVGQFTGPKDKNGKEIFEGDRFHHNDLSGEIYFDDGSFRYTFGYKNPTKKQRTDYFMSGTIDQETSSEMEIIGNIHDTPALTK